MANDDGLTLVEMLAVLAIIGIAAWAAALSIAPVGRASIKAEAAGLARGITRAADASLAGEPAELLVDRHGYAISDMHHVLPPGVALDRAAAFTIDGAESPGFDLRMTQGDERWRVRFDGVRATAARDRE